MSITTPISFKSVLQVLKGRSTRQWFQDSRWCEIFHLREGDLYCLQVFFSIFTFFCCLSLCVWLYYVDVYENNSEVWSVTANVVCSLECTQGVLGSYPWLTDYQSSDFQEARQGLCVWGTIMYQFRWRPLETLYLMWQKAGGRDLLLLISTWVFGKQL